VGFGGAQKSEGVNDATRQPTFEESHLSRTPRARDVGDRYCAERWHDLVCVV
jgi:hypothetical protein